jgi:hypothetical protein
MARQNYAELDEEDFYGQDFERDGAASIWVGLSEVPDESGEIDVLQDLCGVGFYDLDRQASNCRGSKLVPLAELMSELSYAPSFMDAALKAAVSAGLDKARWIIVQYDFAYDPARVKRQVADDPVFLGVFDYSTAT